jgi:serine phosphatase RsbU (regulator of sigma subunit)/tetratricopeptide (TPR) repeat protein
MKAISFCALLFSLLWSANSIAANVDSLEAEWSNASNAKENRLQAANDLAKHYLNVNIDSSYFYGMWMIENATDKMDEKWLIRGYNIVGNSFTLRSNHKEALPYYEKGIASFDESTSVYDRLNLLLNQANAVANSGRLQEGLDLMEVVFDLLHQHDFKELLSNAYSGRGRIYRLLRNLELSYADNLEALRIRETIPKLRHKLASAHNSMGTVCYGLGKNEEAKNHFRNGIAFSIEFNDLNRLSEAFSNLGIVHKTTGLIDSAIYYYNKALVIKEEQQNFRAQSQIHNNLGNVYRQQKKYKEAHQSYSKSLEMARKGGHFAPEAMALLNSAISFEDQNNTAKAIEFAEEGLTVAKKAESLRLIKTSYGLLAGYYVKMGNFKKAYEYQAENYTLKDSINSMAQVDEIAKLQLEYDYQKRTAADSARLAEQEKVVQAKVSRLKAEGKAKDAVQKQERTLRYALIFGLLLVVVFAGFVFNRFRLTQKQKGIIETQKKEVDEAYSSLEEKNTEILDSINYAKRIQTAILPPAKLVKQHLSDSFILYKPKDIVAGDFYWMDVVGDVVLFAVADCTGHGVPGAMVSVVCHNALNRSVREFGLTDPGQILDKTREIVVAEFEKSEEDVKDGMDIALCSLTGKTLQYAGAHNPLWIVHQNTNSDANSFTEIKADKQPIGQFDAATSFTSHTLELQPNDAIYIFSDGFADQFGGPKNKKFKTSNFKRMIQENAHRPLVEQQEVINTTFEAWRLDYEQLDDICIMGVKIG